MQSTTDSLDFVTIEGLLAYGEQFARQPAIDGVSAPTFIHRTTLRRIAQAVADRALSTAPTGF
jgi:hypothetical protein